MEIKYKCPNCKEIENLHYNYDYSKHNTPIIDVLCNECGTFFDKHDQKSYINTIRDRIISDIENLKREISSNTDVNLLGKVLQKTDECLNLLKNK